MPHTVGLIGSNGLVGTRALQYLSKAHKEGKVSLVVLHRPENPPKNVPQGLEPAIQVRPIDLDGDTEGIEAAAKGIQIFISCITPMAMVKEVSLIKALSKQPGFITFIPSIFSSVSYSAEEATLPLIQKIREIMGAALRAGKELGVPMTVVNSGLFDSYFLDRNYLGSDLKANKLQANEKQLRNKLVISTVEYLGAAIAALASSPNPELIANKTFSAVDFTPTGQELVQAFTKAHGGKATEVIDYTAADHDALLHGDELQMITASNYLKHWQDDDWQLGESIYVEGYKKETLDEMVQRFM